MEFSNGVGVSHQTRSQLFCKSAESSLCGVVLLCGLTAAGGGLYSLFSGAGPLIGASTHRFSQIATGTLWASPLCIALMTSLSLQEAARPPQKNRATWKQGIELAADPYWKLEGVATRLALAELRKDQQLIKNPGVATALSILKGSTLFGLIALFSAAGACYAGGAALSDSFAWGGKWAVGTALTLSALDLALLRIPATPSLEGEQAALWLLCRNKNLNDESKQELCNRLSEKCGRVFIAEGGNQDEVGHFRNRCLDTARESTERIRVLVNEYGSSSTAYQFLLYLLKPQGAISLWLETMDTQGAARELPTPRG